MPRKPEPPPIIEIEYDTSPEAQDQYLEAIRFLVHRIRDKQNRATEEAGKQLLDTKLSA